MKDLFHFIPPEKTKGNVELFNFVYESNVKHVGRTFNHSICYMKLVCKGRGRLKNGTDSVLLQPGDLFFTFPGIDYRLETEEPLSLLYIGFGGERGRALLSQRGITKTRCVFGGFDSLIRFWTDAVKRVTPQNALLLTEGVFFYTLSQVELREEPPNQARERFDYILEYVEHHFADRDLTVKQVADLFFYNEKYLSGLFLKKTGERFSRYLNGMRVRHAAQRIKEGASIAEAAAQSGFADPFYFSKVFKRITGTTPGEYAKAKKE